MKCLVCADNSDVLFEDRIMHKYSVHYHQCNTCGLIQTETPYWLDEAYEKAITTLDIGLLSRNINLSQVVFDLLTTHFDSAARFLDYGGGYGVLVRLLRDKGLNFYRQDIYCENIFAANHDISDLADAEQSFELATCFEVFEHTDKPHELLKTLNKYSSSILFSTLLIPDRSVKSASDWWYFVPETGQHITFYTQKALLILADKLNMNFYSNGESLHLFTTLKFNKNPLEAKNTVIDKITHKIIGALTPDRTRLKSLTENDLDIARKKAFDHKL